MSLFAKNIYLIIGGDMSRMSEARLSEIYKLLEQMRVFTLDQMVSSLTCSVPTARMKLKQWAAYTSYNQNGRYYSLPTVPRFDTNGLWHFNDIYFSRYGNLKNTVIQLVQRSSSGLTGKKIGALVGLDPRSFLHHFRNAKGIHREKRECVYVYFSDESAVYREQIKNRSMLCGRPSGEIVSEVNAVFILSALIKHNELCFEDIMALPEIQMQKISPAAIHDFLERYGLEKKTPDTKP